MALYLLAQFLQQETDAELKLDGVAAMRHLAVTAEDIGGVLKQAHEQIAALRVALGK